MFTWVVALVLCPAHCVVHLLLLCGVVVVVIPTILGCFIDPDVVRDVLAVESAGAVGAPRCLFATSVPVVVGITTALTALVVVFVVILVLMWGLMLALLPRLRRVHSQLLLQLVHRHCLLLDLVMLVSDGFLGVQVTALKFFN